MIPAPSHLSLPSWGPKHCGAETSHPQRVHLNYGSTGSTSRIKWLSFHTTKFWGCSLRSFNSQNHHYYCVFVQRNFRHVYMNIHVYTSPPFPFKTSRSRLCILLYAALFTRNSFQKKKNALLTGLRTSGKVIQRGNTMGKTTRNVTCLWVSEGQARLRGWSSSSSPVSVVCCRKREREYEQKRQ